MKVLAAAIALSGSRSQGGELLLDDAPGVGRGLGGVELRGDLEFLDVDLRRRLEAVPGGLEDTLFLLGEERLFGLGRGGLLGRRGRHGGRCWGVVSLGNE